MQHLKTLNVLNKLFALLYFAAGALPLYTALQAILSGMTFLGLLPLLFGVFFIALGTTMWMLGDKLMIGKWKTTQKAIAFLSLLAFPIGTAYGAYALWVCFSSDDARSAYDEMAAFEVFA